ncbi:MAG: hypothetical protein K0S39_5348, partial [Paenibacillus sp.]|nr:hypothetical protein [Paenibacillus sp.]
KALIKIAEIGRDNEVALAYAKESLDTATGIVSQIAKYEGNIAEQFKEINQAAFSWLTDTRKQYHVKDFGFVFERYINQ